MNGDLIDLKICEARVHPASGSTGCKEACSEPRGVLQDWSVARLSAIERVFQPRVAGCMATSRRLVSPQGLLPRVDGLGQVDRLLDVEGGRKEAWKAWLETITNA